MLREREWAWEMGTTRWRSAAVVGCMAICLSVLLCLPVAAVAAPTLQLPFARGSSWWVNGPHSDDGRTGARNSIDLGPGGAGPATVRAAAGGVAHVGRCNGGSFVTIDHGGGWSTRYWHLGSAAKIDGKRVSAGDVVGKTALVCGNPTRFSHVHFALFKGGKPVALSGVSIGGYTVRAGATQYSGYWVRNRDGAKVHTTGANGYAHCCLANNQATAAVAKSPIGNLDRVSTAGSGKLRIAGWAFDPDKKTAAIAIRVYVGGRSGARGVIGYSLGKAARSRPDVAARHKGAGSKHGFDRTIATKKQGRQDVCVYALNVGGGSNRLLGCKSVSIASERGNVPAGMPPASAATADVAVAPDGALILAALKKSGSLYTRIGKAGQGWSDFYLQGRPDSWSAASVAIGEDGKFRLLATKKDGSLFYRIGSPGTGWSDFEPVGLAASWSAREQPDLVSGPGGTLLIAALKKTGTLYTRKGKIGVGWEDFEKQGIDDSWSAAAAALGSDGAARLLATKKDGTLYYRHVGDDGAWRPFEQVGLAASWAPVEQPSLSAGPGGHLVMAAIKATGTLYTREGQIGVGWGDFERQGFDNSWSAASVAVGGDGGPRLLATKKDGSLYYRADFGSGWGQFARQGTPAGWAVTVEPTLAAAGNYLLLGATKSSGTLYSRLGQIGPGWSPFFQQGEGSSWATSWP